ncbi:MAG: AMP-dependent synthetase/ligase [Solirubrobacteraceae bacterium]
MTQTQTEPHAQAPPTVPEPGPQTVAEHLLTVTQRHSGVALQYSRGGVPAYISYPELGTISTEIARGLISLGVQCGDRVAVLGLTSAQWTLADCGSLCAGAIVVPIYHTNSPSECAYVLAHSGARVAICENASQAAKIEQVRDRCPMLEHVVLFEDAASDRLTLDALRQLGSEVPPDSIQQRLASMRPSDLATLVYTSGTTGPPKGCMLTHSNLLTTARLYVEQLGFDDSHSLYQFLPLAHVLARVAQIVALSVGARIIYWSGDPARIVDELQDTSPTHFPAVPRVYEKIHSKALGTAHQGSRLQSALFDWALRCGGRARSSLRRREQPGLLTDLQYRVADPLVLSKVRAAFGPGLQLGLIGAAPVARELLEFFDACGVLVLEGYGLTETCAAATLNTPDAHRFGTVGRPLPGTEIAIAGDGEILIRGPQVFGGYYKDPEATEDALAPGGWLRSGDLGAIDPRGFVTITGRKKDLIITSSGKNISPVNIESELRDQPSITEAVVYGDNRPYLVAMLTLDREESVRLARRLGIETDQATIAGDPRVHAEISKQVDAVNAKFARIEQIKRFAILDHDLTQSDGELTPTLKVKRATVYERYGDLFDGLYEQGGGEP